MPHTPMPHIHRCHMCCLRNSCLNFIEVCNFTVVKRRCRSAPLSGEIHFQCKYRQAAPLGRQPPTSSLSGGHQRLAMRNRKSLTQTRQQCDQHWTSLCRSPTAQTAMSWLSGATVNFLLQIRSFECCTFLAIAVSICNCCFFFQNSVHALVCNRRHYHRFRPDLCKCNACMGQAQPTATVYVFLYLWLLAQE